jgi:thiaminase/transcriptional activator TenA
MSFSQEVWQRNLGLYQKTLALPFNQQLAQGCLLYTSDAADEMD